MNKIITVFFTLVILTLTSVQVSAQEEKKLISGNSLNVFLPQGTLANTYDHGFGVYANFDYNLNKYFALRADLGWNDVSGPETSYIDPEGVIQKIKSNAKPRDWLAGMNSTHGTLDIGFLSLPPVSWPPAIFGDYQYFYREF